MQRHAEDDCEKCIDRLQSQKKGMHKAICKLEAQTRSTDLLTAHPGATVMRLPLGQEPTEGCLDRTLARQEIETDTTTLLHVCWQTSVHMSVGTRQNIRMHQNSEGHHNGQQLLIGHCWTDVSMTTKRTAV